MRIEQNSPTTRTLRLGSGRQNVEEGWTPVATGNWVKVWRGVDRQLSSEERSHRGRWARPGQLSTVTDPRRPHADSWPRRLADVKDNFITAAVVDAACPDAFASPTVGRCGKVRIPLVYTVENPGFRLDRLMDCGLMVTRLRGVLLTVNTVFRIYISWGLWYWRQRADERLGNPRKR